MLKVVIADDEARVCSLIQMLIDWDKLGLELAGVASNGIEALELVQERQPDILITDIRMPGCSGLELIERAKESAPQLEVAIISGYAHFEYAQSAIRFGVSDYLLKPINQQQLTNTLKKLTERCKGRKRIGNEIQELRKNSQEDALRLQNRLMRDLLSGSLEEADAQTLWQTYRFKLETECLQLALVQIDGDGAQVSPTAMRIVEEKTSQIFSQELNGKCRTFVMHINEGLGCMLLGFDEPEKEFIRRQLRKCLNQLCAQSDMFGRVEFSLAVVPPMTDVRQLHDASRQAHMLLKERLVRGTGKMLEKLPQSFDWKNDQMMKPYRQAVLEFAESYSSRPMEEAIIQLEQETKKQSANGTEVYEAVRSAAHLFLQQPQMIDGKEKYERFVDQMAHIGQAKKLFEFLRKMVISEAEDLIARQRNAGTRPIRLAKEYVLQHYHEPITLEKVCEEVGFSVSYFSSLFKKETGENFVHFLMRTRIERAKELLAQTNLSVTEVCTQVGYSDLKYFTQTFRKETNLSPGQYRKLYG